MTTSLPSVEEFKARTFYERLGVGVRCSDEDVARAYREAARLYHPDKCSAAADVATANALFTLVTEAREALKTQLARQRYADLLHAEATAEAARGAGFTAFAASELDPFLRDVMQNASQYTAATSTKRRKAERVTVRKRVGFDVMLYGGEFDVAYKRTDFRVGAAALVEGTVHVKVEPRSTYQQLTKPRVFYGVGNRCAQYEPGDVEVLLLLPTTEPFNIDDAGNVVYRARITAFEMLAGFKQCIEFPPPPPSLKNEAARQPPPVAIDVAPPLRHGQRHTVPGRGVRNARNRLGNFIVEFAVQVPTRGIEFASDEQREYVKQLIASAYPQKRKNSDR